MADISDILTAIGVVAVAATCIMLVGNGMVDEWYGFVDER